ncbi:MAG: aminoglycoside phosphotransferase family protein [Phycisphaeraceae bacterium]|nr:MAG: aminoglycoside phosphotransferase family protein [Phycisphaeraceae bacterium]
MRLPSGDPPNDASRVGVSLRGFSGARLEIVSRGGRGWVRKTAGEGASARLEAERRRLAWLAGIGLESGLFVVPELGVHGEADGRAWYEIEYVPGRSVESVAGEDGQVAGRALGERLGGAIRVVRDAAPGPDASVHAAFLEQKIRQTLAVLPSKCDGHALLAPLAMAYAERVGRLDLEKAGRLAAACGGGCHGDLALDNVLVGRDGGLVLIDPLVSDSETACWDAAKVMQSSLACWGSVKAGDVSLGGAGVRTRRPGGLAALHTAFLGVVLGDGFDEHTLGVHLVVTLSRVMRYVDGLRLAPLLAACVELMGRIESGRARLDEPLDSLRGALEPVLDRDAQVSARDARRADDARARGGPVRRVG